MEHSGGSGSHRSPQWAVELDATEAPTHHSAQTNDEPIFELPGDSTATDNPASEGGQGKKATHSTPIQANPWPFYLEDASPRVYHGPPKLSTESDDSNASPGASPWPYHGLETGAGGNADSSVVETALPNSDERANRPVVATQEAMSPSMASDLNSSSKKPLSASQTAPVAEYTPYRPSGSPNQSPTVQQRSSHSSISSAPTSTPYQHQPGPPPGSYASNSKQDIGQSPYSPSLDQDAGQVTSSSPSTTSFVSPNYTGGSQRNDGEKQVHSPQSIPITYNTSNIPNTPPPAYTSIPSHQGVGNDNMTAMHLPSSESNLRLASTTSSVANQHVPLSPPPLPPRPSSATHPPIQGQSDGSSSPLYPPPPKKSNYHVARPPLPPHPSQRPYNNTYQRPSSNKLFGSSSAKKWLDKTNQVLEDTIDAVLQGPTGPPHRPAYVQRPPQPPRPPQGYYNNQQPNQR